MAARCPRERLRGRPIEHGHENATEGAAAELIALLRAHEEARDPSKHLDRRPHEAPAARRPRFLHRRYVNLGMAKASPSPIGVPAIGPCAEADDEHEDPHERKDDKEELHREDDRRPPQTESHDRPDSQREQESERAPARLSRRPGLGGRDHPGRARGGRESRGRGGRVGSPLRVVDVLLVVLVVEEHASIILRALHLFDDGDQDRGATFQEEICADPFEVTCKCSGMHRGDAYFVRATDAELRSALVGWRRPLPVAEKRVGRNPFTRAPMELLSRDPAPFVPASSPSKRKPPSVWRATGHTRDRAHGGSDPCRGSRGTDGEALFLGILVRRRGAHRPHPEHEELQEVSRPAPTNGSRGIGFVFRSGNIPSSVRVAAAVLQPNSFSWMVSEPEVTVMSTGAFELVQIQGAVYAAVERLKV